MKMKKVIGIGECCVDLAVQMERIPRTDCCVPLCGTSWQGGGKVATALAALGRLGLRADMISVVGDDPYGRFCIRDFQKNGVNTDHITVIAGGKTDFCVCLAETETQGRSFIGRFNCLPALTPEQLTPAHLETADYLHLEAINSCTLAAIGWVHGRGGKVVIDADRYRPEIKENLSKIDVFIGSEYYFEGMFPQSHPQKLEDYAPYLDKIHAAGPDIAIITLGARGCVGMDEAGFFTQPAFTGVKILDTTGAGDVFHGGYIYALSQAMDARQAAQFASAVSAIKCTSPGGRSGIPTVAAVRHFLDTGEIDPQPAKIWLNYYENAIFE